MLLFSFTFSQSRPTWHLLLRTTIGCILALSFVLQGHAQTHFEQQTNGLKYAEQFSFKPLFVSSIPHSKDSPSTFQRCLTMTAFSGMMALFIFALDEPIDHAYALENHHQSMQLFQQFGKIGNLYDHPETYVAIGGIAVAASCYGLLRDNKKPLITSSLMFESWLTSTLINSTIKITAGRHRPYANDGAQKFDMFKFNSGASRLSFPSGHTSSVFSLVTVLAKQYNFPWVKYPAYGFAVSVACQRVMYRKHWASDVIVGGVIGYMSGSWTINRHNRSGKLFSYWPYYDGNKIGMAIAF
jgi:membrane-associated phospholipid phosphatase